MMMRAARVSVVSRLLIAVVGVAGVAPFTTASGQEPTVTKIDVTPLPSRSRELRLLRSFPTEKDEADDVFLSQAQYLSADPGGRIYVSDVKTNQVFVFDKDGRFVMKIGTTGQGPGEFNQVGRALPTRGGLAVLDRGNARIQYFDDRGRFTDSMKLTKSYGDMAVGKDGTVFAFSAPKTPGEMISALAVDGRIKATFGPPPQALLDRSGVRVCWPRISPEDELFIAYWFYPYIQVYSSDGTLRSAFELRYRPIQERLAKNEARAKTAPGGGRVIGEAIIEAIDVDDHGFYVLFRGKRIEILEFRRDGTFVKTYWTAQTPDYYPRGLFVLNEEGRKAFYLLQSTPENKIDVFIEK